MRRFWIAAAILAAALAAALVDREAGLRRWWALSQDLGAAEERVARLREEVRSLESEGHALRDDAFAQERAIREDLELARPGEIIVRFDPLADRQAEQP